MPCHHTLSEMLHAYVAAAGIAEDRKGWLFRASPGNNATVLTEQPMNQSAAWFMVRRRAVAAGIAAAIGNHTFRATGITNFLENDGTLEHAQDMAAHDQALRSAEGTHHAGSGGENSAVIGVLRNPRNSHPPFVGLISNIGSTTTMRPEPERFPARCPPHTFQSWS